MPLMNQAKMDIIIVAISRSGFYFKLIGIIPSEVQHLKVA